MTRMSPETIDNVVSSVKTKSVMVSELLQGRHSASQLKNLLLHDDGPEAQAQAQAHLSQILRSFNQAISLLLPSSSGETTTRRSAPETKDRRGCYKRRKTAHTWTKVSPTLEDDHAWRKYGQKQILHSKFPRSYFRCTRKYDQECKAIKQVQRIEENPEMYQITYIGLHTCNKDILTASKLVVTDSGHGNWESFLNVPNNNESNKVQNNDDDDDDDDEKVMVYGGSDDPPLITTSSSTTTIKQEYPKDQDTPLSDVTDLDPGLWSDFKDFELSNVSSNMASHHHHHHAVFDGFGDYDDFHFD